MYEIKYQSKRVLLEFCAVCPHFPVLCNYLAYLHVRHAYSALQLLSPFLSYSVRIIYIFSCYLGRPELDFIQINVYIYFFIHFYFFTEVYFLLTTA